MAAQHYVPNNVQDPNAHIFGGASQQQQQQQTVQSPGTQFYQAVNAQPHKPLQHIQPQYPDYLAAGSSSPPPPMGGYATYNYGHPAQQPGGSPAAAGKPYDIHNQVYRPTEDEYHTHHHQHKPSRTSSAHHQPSTSERFEKGVGRFFKKIEKKIG